MICLLLISLKIEHTKGAGGGEEPQAYLHLDLSCAFLLMDFAGRDEHY